jgi:hypothetical protein
MEQAFSNDGGKTLLFWWLFWPADYPDPFYAWPSGLPTLPTRKRELAAATALIRRPRLRVMPSSSALTDIRPKNDVTSARFCH